LQEILQTQLNTCLVKKKNCYKNIRYARSNVQKVASNEKIPLNLKFTYAKELFLQHEDEDFFIFGTEKMCEILQNASNVISDGTFFPQQLGFHNFIYFMGITWIYMYHVYLF
jgi:hypothetical protein